MDSCELLERENEFKRLNKVLEKRTESLMLEIETAMGKPDFFSELPHNISLNKQSFLKKHSCDTPKSNHSARSSPNTTPKPPNRTSVKPASNQKIYTHSWEPIGKTRKCKLSPNARPNTTKYTDMSECQCDVNTAFLEAFVLINIQDKVLPPSFSKDNATVERICNFLVSKTKILREQVERLQLTIDKKALMFEKNLAQQADLESERLIVMNSNNNLSYELSSSKARCAALQNKLSEKERLCEMQRVELDSLESRVKQLTGENDKHEAKCMSYVTIIDKLGKNLETAKIVEKEFRIASRDVKAVYQNTIIGLESRIKTLTSRIQKQTDLIENLKRQNTLLATDAATKCIEKEYCNFLNKDI